MKYFCVNIFDGVERTQEVNQPGPMVHIVYMESIKT